MSWRAPLTARSYGVARLGVPQTAQALAAQDETRKDHKLLDEEPDDELATARERRRRLPLVTVANALERKAERHAREPKHEDVPRETEQTDQRRQHATGEEGHGDDVDQQVAAVLMAVTVDAPLPRDQGRDARVLHRCPGYM